MIMSIQNTFKKGVLVDVNIRGWTGEKQLTEQDLGLPKGSLPKAFKLGRKFLIPPQIIRKFLKLDQKTRKLLVDRSYPFPFGGARFVPKKSFVDFAEDFEKLQKQYQIEVDNLIINYDRYRIEMREVFVAAAKAAYNRLKDLKGYIGLYKNDDPTNEILTENEFVNIFLERIEKCYPTPEALKKKYDMTYIPFQMELPDLSQANINDIASESTKIDLLHRGYQLKMKKELEQYAEKIIEENRKRVQTVIDNLTKIFNTSGLFTEASMTVTINMIENFERLNITDDIQIEENLKTFRKKYLEPNSAKEIRESPELQKNMLNDLTKIKDLIKDTEKISALAQAYNEKIKLGV